MPEELPNSPIEQDDSIYSPFIAAFTDKSEDEQKVFFEKFTAQSESAREFLTSMQTVEALKTLTVSSNVGTEYAIAIGKVVAFVVLDEVPISSIEGLLLKLNLSPQQASQITVQLQKLLEPIISDRARASVPQGMRPLPPMTVRIPPITEPSETQGANRNIIDLRKQQPPNA